MDASERGKHPRPHRVSRTGQTRTARGRSNAALDRLAARVAKLTPEQRDRLGEQLDQGPAVSEQLRLAIEASGQSRYAICKATGLDQGQLSKFMGGAVGLGLESVDVLCAYLGLELRARRR